LNNALNGISGNDLKDYCWSNQQYSKCESVGASSIKLTTAVDITSSTSIEVWIDDGFSTGSTATISTTGFDIAATWQGISIIDDPDTASSYSAASQFTPTAAVAGSITDDSYSIEVNNLGASSDYTFSFKVTGGYTVGDSIMIKFPREFDLFVGDAGQWFTEEPDVYYMNCSSTAMGASWCKVSKRVVTVTGSVAVEETNAIDITLNGVCNPATSSRKFIVSLVGSDGAYKAHDIAFSNDITFGTAPTNIEFKSVSVSNHYLFGHSADYTFEFFLGGGNTLDTDETLHVMFPKQWDLYLADGIDSYSCSTTTLDVSSLTASAVAWNSDTACATNSSNTVSLDAVTASLTYNAATEFTWVVNGVSTPEYGETRSASAAKDMDFDDTDFTLFTDYDEWTNKFCLSTYDLSSKTYV
jgi:hypothetical protein